MVTRQTIDDLVFSNRSFLIEKQGNQFAPLCFTQIVLPFIRLLFILGTKFRDVVYKEIYQGTIERLEELVQKWRENVVEKNELDSELSFKVMIEELKRLRMMTQRGNRSIEMMNQIRRKKQQEKDAQNTWSSWDTVTIIPPGKVYGHNGTDQRGPRHNNDHYDIQSIRILPTTEEIFSMYEEAIPGNYSFHPNAHWLNDGLIRILGFCVKTCAEVFVTPFRTFPKDWKLVKKSNPEEFEEMMLT
jgi:hypothetical protein